MVVPDWEKFCHVLIMIKVRKWSQKYKNSINCKNPKGFSQKQHCKYGRKKVKDNKGVTKKMMITKIKSYL